MKAKLKDTDEVIDLAEQGIIACDGRRFTWYQVNLIPEPFDEQSICEGLEEEIERYIPTSLAVKFPTTDIETIKSDIRYIARHFAQWQKEQMMKEALHGWLDEDNEPPYDLNVLCEEKIPFGKFKHGEKVKIIIVKED